jgi:hypothetical protein
VLIPEWFQQQLAHEFGTRFRMRWSNARQLFVLDERIARGVLMTPARLAAKLARLDAKNPDQAEEFRLRLREGTAPFVEISPGNRTACPACGATVRLAHMTWAYAHCDECQKDFKTIYAPLGWWLLEQLRFLDFERGGDERALTAMDQANAAHEAEVQAAPKRELEAAVRDDFAHIMSIQSVGYTGRSFAAEA